MELSAVVFIQVVIIFILMLIGFVLSKTGILKEDGIGQMTDILLMLVTPCVLINAYQKEFSTDLLIGLLAAAFFSLVINIAGIIICTIVFRREETKKYRVSIFGAVYSNCGFMAIPLLSAAMGADGVFYGSAYLAVFTILYWTHGICLYGGSLEEISVKRIITNPGIVGTAIALILFFFQIKLPYVIKESVGYIAGLNTPLAMLVMGAYLTKVDFKKAVKNLSLYEVSGLRLIIIPILAVFLAKIFNIDDTIAKSVVISASCPTAAITALFAVKYRLDAVYAAEIVSLTTVFSIITIPLVMMLL